jgi:hypothetical protein
MLKGYKLGRIIYIISIVSITFKNFQDMTYTGSIVILIVQIIVLIFLFRPQSNNFFSSR